MKYTLSALLILLFGCKNFHRNDSLKISNEILDTIKTAPAKITAAPQLFETAFIKGTTQEGRVAPITLYGVTIGKIKCPGGRIIACDPMHIDEYGIPFTATFPTGEFPVQLSIAQAGDEDLVAFARIIFSEEPVDKWELALLKDQDPLPVGDKKIHGYGVDGGVAIFIDEEAAKVFDLNAGRDFNGAVFKEMDRHFHHNWRYAMYNFGNNNLAAFTTGTGDGKYATYIGYDAAGKPCRLLSDFKLFDWKGK
jgi:hypothetical protein